LLERFELVPRLSPANQFDGTCQLRRATAGKDAPLHVDMEHQLLELRIQQGLQSVEQFIPIHA